MAQLAVVPRNVRIFAKERKDRRGPDDAEQKRMPADLHQGTTPWGVTHFHQKDQDGGGQDAAQRDVQRKTEGEEIRRFPPVRLHNVPGHALVDEDAVCADEMCRGRSDQQQCRDGKLAGARPAQQAADKAEGRPQQQRQCTDSGKDPDVADVARHPKTAPKGGIVGCDQPESRDPRHGSLRETKAQGWAGGRWELAHGKLLASSRWSAARKTAIAVKADDIVAWIGGMLCGLSPRL